MTTELTLATLLVALGVLCIVLFCYALNKKRKAEAGKTIDSHDVYIGECYPIIVDHWLPMEWNTKIGIPMEWNAKIDSLEVPAVDVMILGQGFSVLLKRFYFDQTDVDSIIYARNCAEELRDMIEADY